MSEEDETMPMRGPNGQTSQVKVLDLIDPHAPRADKATRKGRFAVCRECPHLVMGELCGKCGCAMRLKTWLLDATCPEGHW